MNKTVFKLVTELGEEKTTDLTINDCNKEPNQQVTGFCDYYMNRFKDFMERHKNCKHVPPVYYYGEMLKYNDETKDFYNKKAISPELAKYAKLKPSDIPLQKRGEFDTKPFVVGSYGFKYCIRFSHILSPKLTSKGQDWLSEARLNLQILMEEGVVKKSYIAKYDEIFEESKDNHIREFAEKVNEFIMGKKYAFNNYFEPTNEDKRKYQADNFDNLRKEKMKSFYTDIELNNQKFQEFAFATHPDAYNPKLMSELPFVDLAFISLSPDFKEWLGDDWQSTVLQAVLVAGNMDYIEAVKTNIKRYWFPFIGSIRAFSDVWRIRNEIINKGISEIPFLATQWEYDGEFVEKNRLKNE